MKKLFLITAFLLATSTLHAADMTYTGSGQVVTVDPAQARVTLKHGAIKNFSPDGETEFEFSDKKLADKVAAYDLVDFTITEVKGYAMITAIQKTGEAERPETGLPVGKAVQGVLEGTGEVVKTVTTPITPVHDVVGGATDATTGATGAVLDDVHGPETKKNF